jgi:ubiquinone biosynthesis accessory factor UbiJ
MRHPVGELANRALERETWARERLAAHAGRRVTLAVGPLVAPFAIDASGLIDAEPAPGAPDLRLSISPLTLPAFLAAPTRWDEFVVAEGDAEVAATFKDLALTLPWFVEQAFSSLLGPAIGQRAADAGRRLLGIPEYVSERLGDSVASFARDEAGLLARGDEARVFAAEAAKLATRVDALADRLAALEARLPRLAAVR